MASKRGFSRFSTPFRNGEVAGWPRCLRGGWPVQCCPVSCRTVSSTGLRPRRTLRNGAQPGRTRVRLAKSTRTRSSGLDAALLERKARESSMHDLLHSSMIRLAAAVVVALTLTCRDASAEESFEGWNLEPGVIQAHMVMVARVANISQITVGGGDKKDEAL